MHRRATACDLPFVVLDELIEIQPVDQKWTVVPFVQLNVLELAFRDELANTLRADAKVARSFSSPQKTWLVWFS